MDDALFSRTDGQLVVDEAWLALLAGRGRDASHLFEDAHRRTPANPWPLRGLGLAFAEREIEVRAIAFLERATTIDADHAETWYWIGQLAPRDTHAPLALKAFTRATELAPDEADFWAARAGREKGAAALVSLAQATDLDPNSVEAWSTTAWVMRSLGRTEDEVEATRRLVEAKRTPQTLRALSDALRSAGEHDEAGSVAHDAVSLEDAPGQRPVGPTGDGVQFGLVARLLFERGQLDALLAAFLEGAGSHGAASGFWWSFAGALTQHSRLTDALGVLDRLIASATDPAALTRYHRDRAILLESLDRSDDAATAWELMRMHRDFASFERNGVSALAVGPYGAASVAWTTATANVSDPWTRRVRPFQEDQTGA